MSVPVMHIAAYPHFLAHSAPLLTLEISQQNGDLQVILTQSHAYSYALMP